MVTRVWGNIPVLASLSEVRLCQRQTVHYLAGSTEVLNCFKISASEFSTVSMHRRFGTCTYEFLTTVTEGVGHGVYKVVSRSSFGVIQQCKVS